MGPDMLYQPLNVRVQQALRVVDGPQTWAPIWPPSMGHTGVESGSVSESRYLQSRWNESRYLQSRWNLDSQGDIECVTSSHKALYKVGMINLRSTQMLMRGSRCHPTLSRAQDLMGEPSPQALPYHFHCIVSSLSQ